MPSPNTEELNPPASWDEFEDICADLFMREWNDPNVVRYGRSGQRQDGVDIKGREDGQDVGTQCKKKGKWPPKRLTKTDVDTEVREALKFKPKLAKYIIATTAEADHKITDHVAAISARHAQKGLFSVHVYFWPEVVRRIRSNPDLMEKHFDAYVLRQARDDIRRIIALQQNQPAEIKGGEIARPPNIGPGPTGAGLADSIERDFARRYDAARKRSVYPELFQQDEFTPLADELLATGAPVSVPLKREILLRAARISALRDQRPRAERFLAEAQRHEGTPLDASARARLAVADGKPDEAIRILRDLKDEDTRSTLLQIIATSRGDDAALDWMSQEGITLADLSSNGMLTVCQIYLRRGNFAKAHETLTQATTQQLRDAPYFYLLRGGLGLALLFAAPDRRMAINGVPLDARFARPIAEGDELADAIAAVEADFRQALPLATAFHLRDAPRVIEAYLMWCDLLHPSRKKSALTRLRANLEEPGVASALVSLALAYDHEFDPTELLAYLARRDALGGLSNDDLRALLAIRLNQQDFKAVAEIIAGHRELAEKTVGKEAAAAFEIQALARSGNATSAKIAFDRANLDLDSELRAAMRAEIAKAEGADPVTEHLKLYEETKTTEALRALLGALVAKKDHIATARYAEELYERTADPRDLALAARAFIETGDDPNFVRLYEGHWQVREADPGFRRQYGWYLFRRGRQRDAKLVADGLAREYPEWRDLNLEVAIALETGEWEQLAQPLAELLNRADKIDALRLIRGAHLAQASGQGAVNDLIDAAIRKGEDNPHVLLGAYTLYVEEGREDDKRQVYEWFNKALALSGPDGPIQQYELKEVLAKQLEWNEQSRAITDKIVRGDVPMILAGTGLRTTIIDIILRNLIRNSGLHDARRRVAIPLFTGRRLPDRAGTAAVAAFDLTALLVLGWLGLVEKAFATYPTIVLPAGVMLELFEGRRRIRHAQRSRLRRAEEVRKEVADGKLKLLRAPSLARDQLSMMVGAELAGLLREAKATRGVVILPAPVRRLGLQDSDADLTAYQDCLCDMHTLLKVLVDLNSVDEQRESAAKRYFDLQDRGWSSPTVPDPERPIFLDDVALVYLQYTGLLDVFLRSFPNAYVHESTDREAAFLIEHDKHVAEVFRVIEDIRSAVKAANTSGKVVFGPYRAPPSEADQDRDFQSTINLLSDLCGAEVAFLDDRFLNQDPFVADDAACRARAATSLDLIDELRARGVLTEQDRRAARYSLRIGGAMLMPIDAEELTGAAKRNRQKDAPEFRAMQDSFALARVAEIPHFPGEMPWFIAHVHAAKSAIMRIWNEESDSEKAAALARAVLALHPVADEWVGRWGAVSPPDWVAGVTRTIYGALCVPLEITDDTKAAAYGQWLEAEVLSGLRGRAPVTYESMVAYLRDFAQKEWGRR